MIISSMVKEINLSYNPRYWICMRFLENWVERCLWSQKFLFNWYWTLIWGDRSHSVVASLFKTKEFTHKDLLSYFSFTNENNHSSLKVDTKCIVFKITPRENKNAFDEHNISGKLFTIWHVHTEFFNIHIKRKYFVKHMK